MPQFLKCFVNIQLKILSNFPCDFLFDTLVTYSLIKCSFYLISFFYHVKIFYSIIFNDCSVFQSSFNKYLMKTYFALHCPKDIEVEKSPGETVNKQVKYQYTVFQRILNVMQKNGSGKVEIVGNRLVFILNRVLGITSLIRWHSSRN